MFRPLHNRVLIEPDPPVTETSFGLLLPESKEKPHTGTVVVGNSEVKAGDRVLFSLFGMDELKYEGKDYCVVSEKGVLGIL